MRRKIILPGLLILISSIASFAQQKSVTGTIRSEGGDPVGGIIVMVKGTDQGLVTTEDGHFDLIVTEGDVIELTSRYFADREVIVGPDQTYNIQLNDKYGEKRTGYLYPVPMSKAGITEVHRE